MGSSNKQNEVEHTSRRKFAKSIATTLVATPLAASFANAQTPSPATESKALPTPGPTPQQPSPIADAYSEVARARFGKFVTDEEMAKIKEDLEGNVRAAERLRNYKLENGDEPDFVFTSG